MAFAKKSAKPKFEPVWGTEFWTEDVRLQFVHLKEIDTSGEFPRKKFCVMALVPQDDESGLAAITDGICSVVSEYTGKEVSIEEVEKHPLLDGKGNIRDGDESEIEGAAGCYYFTPVANEENQPECLALQDSDDPESVTEIDPSEIYAGCYARLLLLPWMYAEGEVTFALRAVVKTADGERFKTAQAQSAKSSFVAKWAGGAAKPAAAPSKKVVKKAVPEEDEEETEAPVTKKRGRPAGSKGLKAAPEVDDNAEDEGASETEGEEDTPAPVKGKGLAGLNKGRPIGVSKKIINPGYRKPPEEDEEETEAPAPVKKGLGKAKGLSSRL